MAKILESVLHGQISVNDLLIWIETDCSVLLELKSEKSSEFIPYFLNYIKDQCSWLLPQNDKKSENVLDDKKKSPENAQNTHRNVSRNPNLSLKVLNNPNNVPVPHHTSPPSTVYENRSVTREQGGKRVQVINMGCTPYQKRRDGKGPSPHYKQNLVNVLPDFGSPESFPPLNSNQSKTDRLNIDAFPPLGSKPNDTKSKRRITPTPVQVAKSSSTKFGKSQFSSPLNKAQSEAFQTSAFQDESCSLQHERDLLKQTRDKLAKPMVSKVVPQEQKVADLKLIKATTSETYLIPDPNDIDMFCEISMFSEIYSHILTNSLVTNITTELYFIFELLTAKVTKDDQPTQTGLFCFLHNCVYFSVSVLSKLSYMLPVLDKATLSLLCEVPYLLKFSPQLFYILELCCIAREDPFVSLPSLTRVPFRSDDDSKINFADDSSFLAFKKQRDLFYELLREWQETDKIGVSSPGTFGDKALQLIKIGSSSLNLHHLARLFQSQLIASCMCFEVNEVYDELLSDIQKSCPSKLKKLQERFFTPSRVGGLTPPPTFYGIQAFFSELIVSADSPALNQHLLNVFVGKILELNNSDIFSDEELSLLGSDRNKYVFLLHALRLLGKFLGFIHFLPYTNKENVPIAVAKQYLESRKHALPPIDLCKLLKEAVQNHHIVLTVPWVVEYLSMMDPLAQNLDYMKETLKLLIDIYKWKTLPASNIQSVIFLRILIGWLFEVVDYPKKHSFLLQPITFHYPQEMCTTGVDMLAVIDKQLIHSCCPYLIEFKVIVVNFLSDIQSKREVRKITPLSTSQLTSAKLSPAEKLEAELEENFFALHSASLKKTSDFVSDRMASKAINKIRAEVTNLKVKFVDEIVKSEEYKSLCSVTEAATRLKEIESLINSRSLELYDDFRYKVRLLIEEICKDIDQVLVLLLPGDTNQAVIDVCCKISFKNAVNKITEWCDSNLLLDAIKLDVKSKVQHISKGQTDVACVESLHPTYWIRSFRETALKIHLQSKDITADLISNTCSKMLELISADIGNSSKKLIILISIDMFVTLITHFPEKYDLASSSFIQLWSGAPKSLISVRMFICAQNIKVLLSGKSFESSCERYVRTVKDLLTASLFKSDELHDCLQDINALNWQDYTLQRTIESFIEVLTSKEITNIS